MLFSTKNLQNRLIRHLREWHRKLGILAAFFLIFLSISGVLLNHTEFFKLGSQHVESTLLLEHYGINAPNTLNFYHQNELIVTNNLVWMNKQLLQEVSEPVVSLGKFQEFILVVTSKTFTIFTDKGELVDSLNALSGLPSNISKMAISDDYVIVNTDKGYFQTDNNFFDWQAINTLVEPDWITESMPNTQQNKRAVTQYKSQYLTWERIVLDMHSGRFFGLIGVLFMDAVALLLLLLSVSGIYLWVRHSRTKR